MTSKPDAEEQEMLSVIEETLSVGKRHVFDGKVSIRKAVERQEHVLDQPLIRQEVEVERRPIGEFVDAAPPIREEDGMVIVPILEEVLVVEKKLRLLEEVVLRRVGTTSQHREPFVLRREHAIVERESVGSIDSNNSEQET